MKIDRESWVFWCFGVSISIALADPDSKQSFNQSQKEE